MDITILTWINTIVIIAVGVISLIETRRIGAMVSDVANIQRAIFLQLRRQYQDIDKDLQEVRDLLRREG